MRNIHVRDWQLAKGGTKYYVTMAVLASIQVNAVGYVLNLNR